MTFLADMVGSGAVESLLAAHGVDVTYTPVSTGVGVSRKVLWGEESTDIDSAENGRMDATMVPITVSLDGSHGIAAPALHDEVTRDGVVYLVAGFDDVSRGSGWAELILRRRVRRDTTGKDYVQ